MKQFPARPVTLFLLLAVTLFACLAEAEEKVLYLAHPNVNDVDNNPTAAMAVTFKRELEALTDNTIRVEIFPEAQLGNDARVLQQVRQGIIQSSISSVGGIAGIYPLIGVLDYPMVFQSLSDTYAVFDGPFGRRLGKDIEAKTGLAVLGFGDTGGLFVITNAKRPIHNPADMQGLRIRIMGLESHRVFTGSLGAEPVGIPWAELYSSLQIGAVDGQMNPPSIIRFGKLDEVQKYLTVTNHFYTPYVWVADARFLASLTDLERTAVDVAARKAVAASRFLAQQVEAAGHDLSVLGENLQIHHLSNEQAQLFRNATRPAMDRFIDKTLGAEGLALLKVLLTATPD